MDKEIVVKIKLFVILMLLFPQIAMAEESVESVLGDLKESYLSSLHKVIKVKDPDKLAIRVFSGEACPSTYKDLYKMTEGILIRSRVKPINYIYNDSEESLYLEVYLSCIKANFGSGYYIFNASVRFGNSSGAFNVLYDYEFGNYGKAHKSYIEHAVKGYVEKAMTEYVKANFDFGK